MQIIDDYPDLFDPNLYDEGMVKDHGGCYKPPNYVDIVESVKDKNLKIFPDDKQKFFEFVLKE